MGLVNYGKSRWDLLLEKAQLWNDDFDGNVYTEYGNEMEDKIRSYVNFAFECDFQEDKRIKGPYRYHADGFDEVKDTVLEIKTTSDVHDSARGYKKFLVQLLFGMQMFDVYRGLLAVYIRPDDFDEEFDETRLSLFPVEIYLYEDVIQEINAAVNAFMVDLEYIGNNPDATEETLPSRSALLDIANRVVELEQTLVGMKEIEKQCKTLKAQLKEAMEKANVKSWTLSGGTKITLVPDGEDKMVEVFDESQFRIDHTDLYEQYTVSKLQKGKAGYVRITPKKGE